MSSEYTLSLKAVLDTSDVQQKLGQLKQQQQSGQGGVGGGGVQQALQRLNTTLTNLQRSIDKLAAQQGKQTGSSPAAKGTPVVFGNAMRPASGGRPAPAAKASPMAFGADLRQMQREMIGAFGLRDKYGPARQMEPILREWRGFQRHGWTGRKLWSRLDAFDDYTAVENWQAQQGSAAAF